MTLREVCTVKKIGAVNSTIEELINNDLKDLSESNPDAKIKLAVMKFSTGCEWMTPAPVSLERYGDWENIEADGLTAFGEACEELCSKLSKKTGFMTREASPIGYYAPVIILMSDGAPTDNFEKGNENALNSDISITHENGKEELLCQTAALLNKVIDTKKKSVHKQNQFLSSDVSKESSLENKNNYFEDDEDFTDDDHFDFNVKKGWVTLTAYSGDDRVIKIFDILNEIADSAFAGFSAEKIVIPDSVKKIGNEAFRNCKNLIDVTMPDSITEIDTHAFGGCEGITSIEIPNNVEVFNEVTFENCKKLTDVILPYNLIKINNDVFSGCESLVEIDIPESIESIGENAFSDCINLKRVYLPDSLEVIGENDEDSNVFNGCRNVVIEYDGRSYKYGQLKSLYIRINCQ